MRKPSKAKGRLACQHCSDRKKACHWPRQAGEDEACFRCSQSGLECVPQDTTISRRARERLRREQEIDYDEDEGSLGGSVDADSESASLAVPEDEREQVSATAAGRRKRTRDRADQSQPSNLAINIQNPKRQRRQDDSGPVPGRRKRAAESSATSSASPPVPGLSPANGSSEERSGPTDDVNGSPYFPLPPEVPDLVLSPTIESQKDIILTALAAFWSFGHYAYPIIHRETFEAAFNGQGSYCYGSQLPMALLYALAVKGLRLMDSPQLTDNDKLYLSREWTSKARDLLAANYYSLNKTMTDLEAAQTLVILYVHFVSEMLTPSPYAYLERALEIIPRLIRDPRLGSFIGLRRPTDHNDWIRCDMIMRLFIIFGAYDHGFAYLSHKQPSLDVFFRVGWPSHEAFFDAPSSEEAFQLLLQHNLARSPHGKDLSQTPFWTPVDMSPLLNAELDQDLAKSIVRSLIGPIFSRSASSLAALYLLTFFRHMRSRLRDFAASHNIDPIRLASADPKNDTFHEGLYRQHVSVLHDMVVEMTAALPPPFAQEMSTGDPTSLLEQGPAYFGSDEGHIHVLVNIYLAAHGLEIENWMPDGPAQPGLPFFSSQPFEAILESGVVAARMMEGQLASTPGLRWHQPWSFVPALRVGGLHVAAVKMCKGTEGDAVEEAKRGAKITGRWLDAVGRYHKPLGAQMANNFRKLIVDAGFEPDVGSDGPVGDVEDTGPGDRTSWATSLPLVLHSDMPKSFSETVLAVDTWAQGWIQQVLGSPA